MLACIIFSLFASSPPVVNPDAAAVTMVWSYIGELVFNMLVLVGAVKMADRDVYKRQRINFDPNRKYWTIIGKGWQRPKRLYKLGEKYTNDRIMERISKNSYAVKFQSFSEPQLQVKVYRVKGSLKNAKKIGGLRGLYLHYCYKLGILPKGMYLFQDLIILVHGVSF